MDIDKRIEFLAQSTESLHASMQELHATVARHAEESRKAQERSERLRLAMLNGIKAFLEADSEGKNGTS